MLSRGYNQARAWVKGENEADTSREKLLEHRAGSDRPSYGSVVNPQIRKKQEASADNAGVRVFGAMRDGSSYPVTGGEGDARGSSATMTAGYRRLTNGSVVLPKQKWYKHLRIPGVFNRTSPRSNAVHTTKYTILTFIPKNLWEQAHRWANLYFIFIAVLNFVPAVEAIGKEVGFIPVIFVLAVTAIKDIFEDYRRYRSDREVNERLCKVYDRLVFMFVQRGILIDAHRRFFVPLCYY